jgi:hypothetical protein
LSGNLQREVKMQIEIDDEHLDLVFAKKVAECIENLTASVKCLKTIKDPKPYILEDIKENKKDIKALKRAYKFYTGKKYE